MRRGVGRREHTGREGIKHWAKELKGHSGGLRAECGVSRAPRAPRRQAVTKEAKLTCQEPGGVLMTSHDPV